MERRGGGGVAMRGSVGVEEVSLISKQLAILQEYITLKFGSEFENFYRNRLNQNIQSQHQFDNGGVTIKEEDEAIEYDPMSQSMGVIINPSAPVGATNQQNQQQQQQVYYSFQNPAGGVGAFTLSNSQVQFTAPMSTSGYSGSAANSRFAKKSKAPSLSFNYEKRAEPMTARGLLKCPKRGCRQAFQTGQLLDDHVVLDHDEDSLFCSTPGCSQEFPDKPQRQYHEARCPLKSHKCKWEGCLKTFRTSKLLHGHISAVHRRQSRAVFKCSIPGCIKAYPDTVKLKLHEARCRWVFNYNADPNFGLDNDELVDPNIANNPNSSLTSTPSAASASATSIGYRDESGSVDGEVGVTYDSTQSNRGSSMSTVKPEAVDIDMSSFLFVKTEIIEDEAEDCCVQQT